MEGGLDGLMMESGMVGILAPSEAFMFAGIA